MNTAHWAEDLRRELQALEAGNGLRQLRVAETTGPYVVVDGRRLVNLASNDYLGLSQHPHLKQAAAQAAAEWGTGSGASRLVTGTLGIHRRLEERFAAFKGAEAALLFPTGYMANLAAMSALAGRGDRIVVDKLCHASLIDGARASRAELRVYPHLNLAKAKRLLTDGRAGRRLLVTDSVFSMDGDAADLPAMANLAEQTGAILVIDEAHATGVLGPRGAGLSELQGLSPANHITVSTASKALGGLGGIVCGPVVLIDYLANVARPFIYSTAVPPGQVAAIDAALDVVRDEPWRRERLAELSRMLRATLAERDWLRPLPASQPATPILPLVFGEASAAVRASQRLWDAGYWVPAIRPPTVAPGSSRLRISLRADLAEQDLKGLLGALRTCEDLRGWPSAPPLPVGN